MFALVGDRFIVRDWSQQTTLGGGLVLDVDPAPGEFRKGSSRAFLEGRSNGGLEALVVTEVGRAHAVRAGALLIRSRFSAQEICETVEKLARGKALILVEEWIIDAQWWARVGQEGEARIDAFHREQPNVPGLPLPELKAWFTREHSSPDLFGVFLQHLCRTGFAQAGTAIRRTSHQLALPPHLQSAAARLRQTLRAKPLDPPSRKELAPDGASQQALKFLVQAGEVIELSAEVVLTDEAYARALEIVKSHLGSRGAATASELRTALGTSRRILIPLLERLDRDGLTRREGDKRVLR